MPTVKISELPAAGSAASNAVVPATNATGTATEKVTLGQIASLAVSNGAASLPTTGLTITRTGDWVPSQGAHPSFVYVPAQALQFENTYIRYSGKWVSQWAYAEVLPTGAAGRMTSLTFDDLEGTAGQFSVSNMTALTTLSAPNLVFVGSSLIFGITVAGAVGMPALTTLSLPALRYVGGSINAATVNSLTTLSLPALSYVANDFGVGRVLGFPVGMTALTTLSLPALSFVGSNFNPGGLTALTTLSLPALSYVGNFFNHPT